MCKGMKEWGARIEAQGKAQGEERTKKTTAKNMYTKGFSIEETSEVLEESLETIRIWYEEFASPTPTC